MAAAPVDTGIGSEAGKQEEGGARGELAEESRKSEQEVREGASHMMETCAWRRSFLLLLLFPVPCVVTPRFSCLEVKAAR